MTSSYYANHDDIRICLDCNTWTTEPAFHCCCSKRDNSEYLACSMHSFGYSIQLPCFNSITNKIEPCAQNLNGWRLEEYMDEEWIKLGTIQRSTSMYLNQIKKPARQLHYGSNINSTKPVLIQESNILSFRVLKY